MSFKGFLLILLVSLVISMSINWIYTDTSPNNIEYLILGVLVSSNIIAVKWSIIGYKMLLRAHEVVEYWLVNMSRKIFGNYAYQGGVLNKGSTNYKLLTSSGVPFVEDYSSKVRIFHDNSKLNFYNLHKRGCVQPNVAALSTLIDVSQQQNWLREIPTDEILAWLWQIGASNANDAIMKQPFVRFALNELKQRAQRNAYDQVCINDVIPEFEGHESFECQNVKSKPIVRYA